MNLETITLMNMKSRLDSSPDSPVPGGTLSWNSTDQRYDPTGLKTIGSETIYGSGDITAGGQQAFYVVDLVATSNITLTGSQTVDGESSMGKKVLLTNQSDPKQNGVYQDIGGTWTRLPSYDTGVELRRAYFYADSGVSNWNTFWRNTNATAPTVGTDPIAFEFFEFQEKLVSGVNIKTINGTAMTSGSDVATSSSPPTGKDFQLVAAENMYPGDLAYLSADGTKVARGYGPEYTGDWFGVSGGALGVPYNIATTAAGPAATNIPTGGSNYYYGKVFVTYLKRGTQAYGRICRVYRKNGTDNQVYLQTGTMTAAGMNWDGPENSFTWSATAIWGVYPVGYDRIVVHTGNSTFNSNTASYLWSGQFDAAGNLIQKNFFNLDTLADTKGADITDFTLPAEYTSTGISRFLLAIKYGTSFQVRLLSIDSAGVITSSAANTTGFTSVLSTGANITGRQVVKCLRYADSNGLVMTFSSTGYTTSRSIVVTGNTSFTYGATDRNYALNDCRLFDATCVSYGLPAKIALACNSRSASTNNEIGVRIFTTDGGDVAPTGGSTAYYTGTIRCYGDGTDSGDLTTSGGVKPTHLKVYKVGSTAGATTLMVVARTMDSTSSSATDADCNTFYTAMIPFFLNTSYTDLQSIPEAATFASYAPGYSSWEQYDGISGWLAIAEGTGTSNRGLYCFHTGNGNTYECAFDFSYKRESISTTGTFLGVVKTRALAGSVVTVTPKGAMNTSISRFWFQGIRTVTYMTRGRKMYMHNLPVLTFNNPLSGSEVLEFMSNSAIKLKAA